MRRKSRSSTIRSIRPSRPMNDVRVRKAFNMAIDKEALAAYPGRVEAADGVYP